MKILHVINSLATGGAEKLLLESIPIYNEKGINTDVLLLNGNNQPFLEVLKQKNCCAVFSLSNGSVYNPLLIFKLISYFKKYDVIHVHLFPSLYWVAFAKIISFSKIKLVYTEHSTTNNRRNNFILKQIDKIAYSQYNTIVCITEQVKINLKKHLNLKTENKLKIIQNGLNLNQIQEAKPYNKNQFFNDENAKIIIQVARFFEPKDHKTLIKAIQFLPENVKLILVGDGILKKECEDLVQNLHLQDRIIFLGVRTDVLQLLKTADVIVLSSKHEGLSLSSIEGMASGKPFVASNVPGLKEMVENNGVLFQLGDEKKLAQIINELLSNQEYYNQVVQKCISKSNQYSIYKMVDEYCNIYKNK